MEEFNTFAVILLLLSFGPRVFARKDSFCGVNRITI